MVQVRAVEQKRCTRTEASPCTDHQICCGNDRFRVLMLHYICCNTSLQPWGKHKITGTCTKHILYRKWFIFRNHYNTTKYNLQNAGIWSPYHFNIGLCIEYEPGHKVFTADDFSTIALTDFTTQVVIASSAERYSESTADPFWFNAGGWGRGGHQMKIYSFDTHLMKHKL